MIGVLAELERSMITERTRAGMKAARARGIHPGRKPSLSPVQIETAKELRKKKHPDEIARILKCSRATVYRALAG
jgi:DNA invertase Pin-like site-specific DNA recombinase